MHKSCTHHVNTHAAHTNVQVPVWIGWIKYLSFVYWGYNLLIKVQFRGATYYDNGVPVDLKVGDCVY